MDFSWKLDISSNDGDYKKSFYKIKYPWYKRIWYFITFRKDKLKWKEINEISDITIKEVK